MIDFHVHLLPGVDDGSRNCKMSAMMLKESKRQGVTLSIATPHFYFDKSIDKMIAKREKALCKLLKFADKNNLELPEIVTGFEVYLSEKIYEQPELDKLLISGTNTMLVEMPRKKWDDEVFSRLEYVAEKGYEIVLAHPERYIGIADEKEFDRLFSYGFACQLNAASMLSPVTKDFACKLIEEGKIHIIGSDAHNNGTRSVFIEIALEIIAGKFGKDFAKQMKENAERFLCVRND